MNLSYLRLKFTQTDIKKKKTDSLRKNTIDLNYNERETEGTKAQLKKKQTKLTKKRETFAAAIKEKENDIRDLKADKAQKKEEIRRLLQANQELEDIKAKMEKLNTVISLEVRKLTLFHSRNTFLPH